MLVAPRAPDEANRLGSLVSYGVLDTPADSDYDAITALVSAVCDVPIALVSFVDENRQWFKSQCGLAVSETPRDISFCGHAILAPDQTTIVPDALADPRFADNPLVTGEPHIRFYAGTPLISSDGYALGTLCIIDRRPRELTEQQLQTLRVATNAVCLLLEQRRTIARLEAATKAQQRVEAELRAEIAQREHVQRQLTFSSSHDGLTRLPNRAAFMLRLQTALDRLHANPARCFAVSFIDLDQFKNVNDTLGHDMGDRILVEVGQRLSSVIRTGDAVARLGGDEFTMLIDGTQGEATATSVARRTADVLGATLRVADAEIMVTASIGVVMVDATYTSVEDILRDADIAMYASKARGRNCFTIFTAELREGFVRAAQLQSMARAAFEKGEFELAYQPVIPLRPADGEVRAVEALLRWRQPDGTLVSAVQFIETAEQSGLIVEIGDWVLREACMQMRRWQIEHGQTILMAVNVSARQLAEPDFARKVKETIHATGIDPRSLALEVTETVLVSDVAASMALMTELRHIGVRMYLDDFGTGYSSLDYLRRFPLSKLKIDRSFVSGNGDGLADPVIVSSIVSLAHKLGLRVVAEGVETHTQRAALMQLGCDYAQGFLFSQAVTAAEVLPYISNSGADAGDEDAA